MLVELIGPTGAGKSTLATLLCGHLGGPATATTATDLVMDRPLLRRVHHEQVANLVQDVRGLPHLARTLPRQAEVLRLSARLLLEHAPSRLDLLLNARSVMRRIGMFELARATAAGRVVLLDEGPVLIAYHLFVYSSADLAAAPLQRFADTVPLPDRIIYVRPPLPVLAERARSRPVRRRQLAGLTPEQAEVPLRRALEVFDRLVAAPPLQERTTVVENASQDPQALDRVAAALATTLRAGTGHGSGPRGSEEGIVVR